MTGGGLYPMPLAGRVVWALGALTVPPFARLRWSLEVDRRAAFPEPPYVVAANHPSSLDPVLVGSLHRRRLTFVAVDLLLGTHPMLDLALRWFGTIPIPRHGVPLAAMRASLDHLRAGGVLGMFPEGTRVPTWGDVEPRPGAAWLAVRAGVPIVPVAMKGTDEAFTMDLHFGRGHVEVVIGPPLHPRGHGRPAVDDLHDRWSGWISEALGSRTPS